MQWQDAVWTPSSVPGSQCIACAQLALATLLSLQLSAIPGEQGLLEAAGLPKQQQQLCQAGSSSLLPAIERRKKEENLVWIWPDSSLSDSRTPVERFKLLDDPQDPKPPSPCLTAPHWKPKNILKTDLTVMEFQVRNFCDANKTIQNAGADGKKLFKSYFHGVFLPLILLSLLPTLQPSPVLRARRHGQGISRTEGFDMGKENLFLQKLKSSLGERIPLQGMTLHLLRAETKIIHT